MKEAQLERVIVGVDFSTGSRLATERALNLPLHPKAAIHLIRVIPADIGGDLQRQAKALAKQQLEAAVDVARRSLERNTKASQVSIEGFCLEGDAALTLVARAHELQANVIVIGRNGHRSQNDAAIGSTAQEVIRRADVPVLVSRLPSGEEWTRVLAAVDVTLDSVSALDAARKFSPKAKLAAFGASTVPFEEFVELPLETLTLLREQYVDKAEERLEKLLERSGVKAQPLVRNGDPRLLVLEQARASDAQLLVIGTGGLGEPKDGAPRDGRRQPLGLVAERIITHAPCDVLVVRG